MVQPVECLLDLQYTSVLATGFHATADLSATCFTELSPGHCLLLNSCPKHWVGGPTHSPCGALHLFCRVLILSLPFCFFA